MHCESFRRPRNLSAFTSSAVTTSKFDDLKFSNKFLISKHFPIFSGWIEDTNINPFNEHKAQMLKLGKPKASFNKAIKEIEDFMKDPAVSQFSSFLSPPPQPFPFIFRQVISSQHPHVKLHSRRFVSHCRTRTKTMRWTVTSRRKAAMKFHRRRRQTTKCPSRSVRRYVPR